MIRLDLPEKEKQIVIFYLMYRKFHQLYYHRALSQLCMVQARDIFLKNKEMIHRSEDFISSLFDATLSSDVLGRLYINDVLLEVEDLFGNLGYFYMLPESYISTLKSDKRGLSYTEYPQIVRTYGNMHRYELSRDNREIGYNNYAFIFQLNDTTNTTSE